jgi:hypothetical protein
MYVSNTWNGNSKYIKRWSDRIQCIWRQNIKYLTYNIYYKKETNTEDDERSNIKTEERERWRIIPRNPFKELK